jgi:hypothetical protein
MIVKSGGELREPLIKSLSRSDDCELIQALKNDHAFILEWSGRVCSPEHPYSDLQETTMGL